MIRREIIENLRKPNAFLYLLILLTLLFVDVLYIWVQGLSFTYRGEHFIRDYFLFFIFLQACFSFFLVPVLSATSINQEFERRTWDLLRTTHLSTYGILNAKLLSSVTMILLMIISIIPFYSILLTMGSIAPGEIFFLHLLLLEGIIVGALIGLLCSSLVSKTVNAITTAYILLFLYLVGPLLIAVYIMEVHHDRMGAYLCSALTPIGLLIIYSENIWITGKYMLYAFHILFSGILILILYRSINNLLSKTDVCESANSLTHQVSTKGSNPHAIQNKDQHFFDGNPILAKEKLINLENRHHWFSPIPISLFFLSIILLIFHQSIDKTFYWEALTLWAVLIVPLLMIPFAINSFRHEYDSKTWDILCTTTLRPFNILWGKLWVGMTLFLRRFWAFFLPVLIVGLFINNPHNMRTMQYSDYLFLVVIITLFHIICGIFYMNMGFYYSATSKSTHAAYVKLVLTILTLIWTPFALFFLHNSRENEVLSVAGFVSPLAFLMHSLTYDYASMESILARFLFLTLVMAAVSRILIYRTTQRIGVRQ